MPAGATYECIAKTTLSSNQTSITVTSIPSGYTDLVVILQGRTTVQNITDCGWYANGDTGANYSFTRMVADNGGLGTDQGNNQSGVNCGMMGYGETVVINQYPNYSGSTYKMSIQQASGPTINIGHYMICGTGSWRSTSAINQLQFYIPVGQSGQFEAGMTATVYGITAA